MELVIDLPEACKPIDLRDVFCVGDRVSCLPFLHQSCKKNEDAADYVVDAKKDNRELGKIIFVSPYFISVKMKYYTESFSAFDYRRGFVYAI